jgi:energy-coupling factor transport system ATP-binding protein
MICVENAVYRYPQSNAPVLTDFSACFDRGEVVAVTGRNGCGKTTLTKLLVGILRPEAGVVTIDGSDASRMDLFEIGQRVGYIFQNPNRQLFCDAVYNEVAYGLRNSGLDETLTEEKADHYLEYFDLDRYRETYPGKLSHGEKQRLALAAVLALGTDYIVLDEPTAGLDVRRQRELGDMLSKLRRERSCGIIIVSHETDFVARFADRELVMSG